MARMSVAASLMGLAAAAILSGYASAGNHGNRSVCGRLQRQLPGLWEAPSQDVSLTCSGIERPYVAYPESVAHRYSPCSAYTFDSAGGTGAAG